MSPKASISDLHPLSPTQERKLVDHIEQSFLDITRGFKKRSDPSSTLPTLSSYLASTHTLLSLILQIPPLYPSSSLRTILLLRLTGDFFTSVPGYSSEQSALPELLKWLEDLDKGWLSVLRSQAWDTTSHTGVDVILSEDANFTSVPVSQTERTRLRSLLITGSDNLEEWLEGMELDGEEFEQALERLGVKQGFEDLFYRTLGELGAAG